MESVKRILLGIGALIGGSILTGVALIGFLLGGFFIALIKTLLVILGVSGLIYMGVNELREEKKSDASTKAPPP